MAAVPAQPLFVTGEPTAEGFVHDICHLECAVRIVKCKVS